MTDGTGLPMLTLFCQILYTYPTFILCPTSIPEYRVLGSCNKSIAWTIINYFYLIAGKVQ